MQTPYFPFYPQDWLADPKVAQLNYEERGVYFELLCRAWTFEDGSCSLPDDDSFLCRILNLRPAKWRKLRSVLVDGIAPVFRSVDGRLVNGRLLKEYGKVKEKSRVLSANAKKRWGDESSESATNKKVADANAEHKQCLSDSDTKSDTKTDRQTAMAYFSKYFPAHLSGGAAAKVFIDYGEEMGWDVALEALKRTTAKDKDWSYAAAILRNWSDAGVKSMAGVQVRDDARRKTAVNGPSQPTKRDKWKPASPPTEGKHEQLA